MADPRLQWRQLSQAQPNVSGLLQGAGQSLSTAAEAARGILSNYQEGQELAAENELARRIGGRTQEELTNMFRNGDFDDLNLGEDGLSTLNSALSGRAELDNKNSIRFDRDGRLVLARNEDTRRGEIHGWNIHDRQVAEDRRQAEIALAPYVLGAQATGNQLGTQRSGNVNVPRAQGTFDRIGDHVFGNADPNVGPVQGNIGPINANPDQRLLLARTLQAEAGNQGVEGMLAVGSVIRNRMAAGQYGDGLEGVILRPGQFSVWNSSNGYAGGDQGQNMNFEPSAEALAAADAILSGQYEDVTRGATHYYNPEISQPAWGGQINNTNFDSALLAGQSEALSKGTFTAAEINSMFAPAIEAADSGQARLLEELSNSQKAAMANIAQSVVANPQLLDSPAELGRAIREQLAASGIFSDDEVLASEEAVLQLIANSPSLLEEASGGSVGPVTEATLAAAAENTIAAARRQLEGTDGYRAYTDIQLFRENPTETLESSLGIPEDLETRGDYRTEYLRRHVNDLANKYNVTPAVMAVAMRDAFIPDPGEAQESRWWDIDFTTNRIANRFDEDVIAETIQQLTPEMITQLERAESAIDILEVQIQTNQSAQRAIILKLNKAIAEQDTEAEAELKNRLAELQAAEAEIIGTYNTQNES